MSDIDVKGPTFRRRITRDWKFWAALASFFLALSLVIAMAVIALAYRTVVQDAAADTEAALCNSRAQLEVTRAMGDVLVEMSSTFVAAIREADLASAAVDLGAAGERLQTAIDARQAALERCAANVD